MKRILASIITILICFTACGETEPNPPTVFPFAVHKAGATVTTELQVKKTHPYWLDLQLWHKGKDEAERERIKKLVGSWQINKDGRSIEPGIPIPLKITISVLDSSGEHTVREEKRLVGDVWGGGGGAWF